MAEAGDTGLRAAGTGTATLACVLLGCGLLLANPAFLCVAAAFALLVLLEAWTVAGFRVAVESKVSSSSLSRGDCFEVETSIRLGSGLGTAFAHFPMPAGSTIEGGNNFRAFPLLPWPQTVSSRVRATARARGEFVLPAPTVKVLSLWGQFSRTVEPSVPPARLSVRPRHHLIKRFRELRTFGRTPLPDNSFAFTGMRSDSFKELREYRPGDKARRVNWRASAKALSAELPRLPLVNEYEVEGKKVVWLFVDGSPHAEVGTAEENAFEYFLDASLSLASYFISRGYKVGASIFASGVLVRSDSGTGQVAKVLREFVRAEPAVHPEPLAYAVESARAFLAGDRPLCFILTRPEVDPDEAGEAVRRLRAIIGRRAKVFVVAVRWPTFHPRTSSQDAFAAKAMDAVVERSFRILRKAGATPIRWDPRSQRFGELLSRVAAASGAGRA